MITIEGRSETRTIISAIFKPTRGTLFLLSFQGFLPLT
jgi:hypothetical protein